MQQGWITLNRSIVDHWLHKDKPFCRFGAWIDLILMANHEERKLSVGGSLITIERGQLFTSSVSLSERWGWSRGKVQRFLECLESDQMLIQKRTSNGQLLTLVNYGFYQDGGRKTDSKRTANGQRTDSKRTADGHQTDTNNNVNNDNNENNVNNETKETLRYFPSDEALEKTFADFRDMRKKIRKPMTDRAIELMIRKLNKYDPDIAIKMLEQSIVNCWQDVFELKDNRGGRETKIERIADRWADVN